MFQTLMTELSALSELYTDRNPLCVCVCVCGEQFWMQCIMGVTQNWRCFGWYLYYLCGCMKL